MLDLWVFAETDAGAVLPVGFELLGKARAMADEAGGRVTAVFFVASASEMAAFGQTLIARGADRAIAIHGVDFMEETRCAAALRDLLAEDMPGALLIGATAYGRSLAPRLAAMLRAGLTADCTALAYDRATGLLRQTRPAFGGNLIATIVCEKARPQMATVRPGVFAALPPQAGRMGEIIPRTASESGSPITWIDEIRTARAEQIDAAPVLVAIGAGIGSDAHIALANQLAKALGGTLAASRALVDAGRVPYARQVGQTGKTVSPKLYIACGISGAAQHMAGVAADVVVAVNTDPHAPIFEQAHYAVVRDCGDFLRAMLDALQNPPAQPIG